MLSGPAGGVAKSRRVRPGLGPALPLHGTQPLPGDGQLGRVDDLGLAAAVGELQRAVPLALRLAHDGAGGVVLDLGRHSGRVRQMVVVTITQTGTRTISRLESVSSETKNSPKSKIRPQRASD